MRRVQPIAEIIESMEAGLDRAVLRCLQKREGKSNAAQKMDLISDLNMMGFGNDVKYSTFERQVRQCIQELRNDPKLLDKGILIGSSSGGGGYYLVSNLAEFDEFIQSEYRDRIQNLQDTVKIMTDAATARWGTGIQMGLL